MKKLLALLMAVGFTGTLMAQQAQPQPAQEQKQEKKSEQKTEQKKTQQKTQKKEGAPAEQKK